MAITLQVGFFPKPDLQKAVEPMKLPESSRVKNTESPMPCAKTFDKELEELLKLFCSEKIEKTNVG